MVGVLETQSTREGKQQIVQKCSALLLVADSISSPVNWETQSSWRPCSLLELGPYALTLLSLGTSRALAALSPSLPALPTPISNQPSTPPFHSTPVFHHTLLLLLSLRE